MLAGPKGGKWLANPPNPPHLDPLLRTPLPPKSTYHVKNKQLTSPHISTVAPSSRSLSTINIGVVPGTTMVHGILSFLAE